MRGWLRGVPAQYLVDVSGIEHAQRGTHRCDVALTLLVLVYGNFHVFQILAGEVWHIALIGYAALAMARGAQSQAVWRLRVCGIGCVGVDAGGQPDRNCDKKSGKASKHGGRDSNRLPENAVPGTRKDGIRNRR